MSRIIRESCAARSAAAIVSVETLAWLLSAAQATGATGIANLGSTGWEVPSSADDITLFLGESQSLTVSYHSPDLTAAAPVVTASDWNVPHVNIPAPVP
jgi:hypothetical protein